MPTTHMMVGFSAGVFSPTMNARVDLERYTQAAARLENLIVLPEGGITRRPGTVFVAPAKDSAKAVRLVPFIFAETQAYVLEFGAEYIRFFTEGGQVMTGTPEVIYEIASPYTEDQVGDLKLAQSADTVYIAHPEHAVRKLVRLDHDNWQLTSPSLTIDSGRTFNTGAGKYPRAVAFYEQRLFFGGSLDSPQAIWASRTGDYEDFSYTGAANLADDGLKYVLASGEINSILWMEPAQRLSIGTVGGVFQFDTGDATPTALARPTVTRDVGLGSANIQGRLIDNRIIYLQRFSQRVRELAYELTSNSYASPDLTRLAKHITQSGVVCLAYSQTPESLLWLIRADGALIGLSYDRQEGLVAWHGPHRTAGDFESAAVIPGQGGDELWLAVRRTINGQDQRYIERLNPLADAPVEESFFVDAGLSYHHSAAITALSQADPVEVTAPGHGLGNGDKVRISGVEGMTEVNSRTGYTVANAATDTFELSGLDGSGFAAYTSGGLAEELVDSVSGLDHLEGLVVDLLLDGSPYPFKTVSAGAVSLDRPAARVQVGLGYTSLLQTLSLNVTSAEGIGQARLKSLIKLAVRVHHSVGGKIGWEVDELDELITRRTDSLMDAPLPPVSGDLTRILRPGYATEGRLVVVQDQPLPLTLLGLILEVEPGDLGEM